MRGSPVRVTQSCVPQRRRLISSSLIASSWVRDDAYCLDPVISLRSPQTRQAPPYRPSPTVAAVQPAQLAHSDLKHKCTVQGLGCYRRFKIFILMSAMLAPSLRRRPDLLSPSYENSRTLKLYALSTCAATSCSLITRHHPARSWRFRFRGDGCKPVSAYKPLRNVPERSQLQPRRASPSCTSASFPGLLSPRNSRPWPRRSHASRTPSPSRLHTSATSGPAARRTLLASPAPDGLPAPRASTLPKRTFGTRSPTTKPPPSSGSCTTRLRLISRWRRTRRGTHALWCYTSLRGPGTDT